jgi:hypothetical protein
MGFENRRGEDNAAAQKAPQPCNLAEPYRPEKSIQFRALPTEEYIGRCSQRHKSGNR